MAAKRERLAEPCTKNDKPSTNTSAADDARFLREMVPMIAIDKHDLDNELSRHADLLYRISERLVEVTAERDQQKTRLAEIEASVDQELRLDAERSETKITEKAIEMQRKTDSRVQLASLALSDLNTRVAKLGALKEAFLQRKTNMSDLTSLYVANYWADAETGSARKRAREVSDDALRAQAARGRRGARDDD